LKKNLTAPKKEVDTVGSFLRLPKSLKEKAQIFCIKNKISLTDLIIKGLEEKVGK
tara:strand:+ start:585 stop:749 length:165 start_codon:yes stop_codon:yes gene_type:complete